MADETPLIDRRKADQVKKRAEWFILYDRILHKHSYACLLLICVTPKLGSHIGGWALAIMALLAGYY